ncbi:hypothetical protein [Ignicoccus hospitalis]|nr:hypothetical protein [Ignicoccus hospitalis]HIH89922.1 hypothetical protein [Desulfurococcaceae archaeon]
MSEVLISDVESEEECLSACEARFCHGALYSPSERLCKCLLCTGPLRE